MKKRPSGRFLRFVGSCLTGKFVCWLVLVFWAALWVFSDIPGFAPSGDLLFFEMRKEK
jgi:hypothetical protein